MNESDNTCVACQSERRSAFHVPRKRPGLHRRYEELLAEIERERDDALQRGEPFREPRYVWRFCTPDCRRAWLAGWTEWSLMPERVA